MSDVTPEGDPIDTRTIWLPFADGEVAITADLTRFNAAMRRADELTMRDRVLAAAADFDAAVDRVNAVMAITSQELRVSFGLSDPNPFPRLHLFRSHSEKPRSGK